MKLSVVIPMYNEEGNVLPLYNKLLITLKDINYELIFINDGSSDNTYRALKSIYNKDPLHVKVINFSRNFGKDAALYAGLSHASGEYSVVIDGDCQHNPKYLIDMMNYLDENDDIDIIAMVNKKRGKESKLNKLLKNMFYSFMDKISDTPFVSGASDFRMFRDYVTSSIVSLNEVNRFSKGIFSWVGFNTHYIEYIVEDRNSGKTSFNLFNQFKYALGGIVNFSIKPLKLASFIGCTIFTGSFLYFIFSLVKSLVLNVSFFNLNLLYTFLILISSFQLITIGILGKYISSLYIETKKRPIYVAKNKLGFTEKNIL